MTVTKTLMSTTAAAAVALGLTAAPASAQEFNWSMATPWSGGHWMDIGAKGFAALVEEYTDGRVKLEVFPAGTLGSALKVTETVQSGIAEAGHNWPGYDYGIDKTGVVFGGWAGGLKPEEYLMWLHGASNGAELWDQWRQEQFDVVSIPCSVGETEIFLHSHKPVETLEDYQGMKVRTSGAWAEIASTLGASTVVMPGSEVFSALERQIVDGIEWGGPGINSDAGFDKIAEYIVTPGVHQPGAAHECMFNKDAWDQLSEHDQNMIRAAGQQMLTLTYIGYGQNDLEGYQALMEGGNNTLVQLSDEFIAAARDASVKWGEEQAAENEWFKKAFDNQQEFRSKMTNWPKFRSPIGG